MKGLTDFWNITLICFDTTEPENGQRFFPAKLIFNFVKKFDITRF